MVVGQLPDRGPADNAIVKQLDATILLLPAQTAEVHKFGSLVVREMKPQ